MRNSIVHSDFESSGQSAGNMEMLLADHSLFRSRPFSADCYKQLKAEYSGADIFLTHSATGAIEMMALLLDLQPDDEVILPSFTYVSTAVPFALRNARPVFVDIDPVTLNIDAKLIRKAITPKTKAILVMHYAGFACDMEEIISICNEHNIVLLEDAAMSFGCSYKDRPLGTFGAMAVVSFDITKQVTALQGGLLIVNDTKYKTRASDIYHIGTNRAEFSRGDAPYFEWVDIGSKFHMPETHAAILAGQLPEKAAILQRRKQICTAYHGKLQPLAEKGLVQMMPYEKALESVHLFYLILKSPEERDEMIKLMRESGIEVLFHYIPLHSSRYGRRHGRFTGDSDHTSAISSRLLRLPLHVKLTDEDVEKITDTIYRFFA